VETIEQYLRLGLRLGRHVDGVVDAYYGPPELAAEIDAAPPKNPRDLVADAEALLADLQDSWLRDQALGLHTFARVLAGDILSYADEVEGCYGIRPTHTDESVFSAAHERLEELLPGDGTLTERHDRWRQSMLVPADRIEPAITAVIEAARAWTRELVDLPDGEGVDLETVRDVAWLGYNSYLGGLRGRVSINVDLPMSAHDLLQVALHEAYPGHQAEHASKEHLLVRGQGRLEESIRLGPTPSSVVSEGIGRLAPRLLLATDPGPVIDAVERTAGVRFDLAQTIAVDEATEPCRWAQVNAALMLHRDGASADETEAYLRRWGVVDDDIAAHLVRFIAAPSSRTYVVNYPAGLQLCAAYVDGDPARLRCLLTEQIRVRDLTAVM
jgi:hypothetical protein